MSGNFRDSSHRSPVPFEYCTCRCNSHFDQYSAFSRSYSTHMTNTTHTTTTHSHNTHYNKDIAHNHRDSTSKFGAADLGDSSYVNAASKNLYNGAYANNAHARAGAGAAGFGVKHKESDFSDDAYKNDSHGPFDAAGAHTDGDKELIHKFKNLYTSKSHHERDSPVLSDGTDFTHGESVFESGEYLERLHCASCDKPLLIYTSLDFKLFDNWVNYVFYHKAFSPSLHPSAPHEHPPNAQAASSDDNVADASEQLPEDALTERVVSGRDEMSASAADTDRSVLDHTAAPGTKDGMDGDATDGNYDHKLGVYVDSSMEGYEEPRYAPVAYENEDLRSIGDITGSILMSSEETLFTIINGISPGEQCTNEKNQLFDSVKRFLQYCLGEDTIVHLTGSTAYDIDIDYSEGASAHSNSDLDIVLLSNAFGGDPRVILHKVYNELSNMQHVLKERNKCPIWVLADSNIKLVESAKVPIVIIETKNGLLCDISVNTLYPLLHTELFKSYIDEHPMVRPLMRIIKHWLLVRGLPSMKEGGFPSILWMSLFCNSLDASIVNATSNLELLSYQFGAQSSVDGLSVTHADNMVANSADFSVADAPANDGDAADMDANKPDAAHLADVRQDGDVGVGADHDSYSVKSVQHSDQAAAAPQRLKSSTFNTANYNYAAAAAAGITNANQHHIQHSNSHLANHFSHEAGTFEDFDYKEDEEEEDEDYDELNMSETYREMFVSDWMGACTIGQLWERMQGGRGEFGILCSLEKCFMNLSKGISVMDIVSRFPHIKNGSDYGGMSLFCKNIFRLIEMEPNVPYGTWLVYYYELNRANEYMTLYSKRLEILVTLLVFLRLLCNNSTSLDDLKALASGIQQSFGYDLSYLWNGTQTTREYNSLYVNNQYNLNMSMGSDSSERLASDLQTSTSVAGNSPKLVVSGAANLGAQPPADLRMTISANTAGSSSMDSTMSGTYASKVVGADSNSSAATDSKPAESSDVMSILDSYLTNVASLFRIQLRCEEPETSIKLLIYHMFQQFKSIPNEIFERVQDNIYSIPVAIEPPSPIEEDLEFGHRLECGLWDDSGWYIVVLQERLCVVKVIKICIEWEFWWSKDFVSRRDTRSIFHGFVYRQLRLDLKKQTNYSSFSTFSINSPSILVKRGSLVLFNPCDIVSKLHVLKVVKHEQYISPSLYSTDFYTGVKCLYVLPGFEVDRFMCFEQIAHKLKHYVEFRPNVTFCKLCGIVNMKKINTYTENKIPQRKLRNAKYVLCNQKYNHIYNLMQYKHSK